MEFPVTIDSQDAFDNLVKDRIKRAETKAVEPFADYNDLKAKAESADQAIADAEAKATAATERAETAEATVKSQDEDKAIQTVRAEVAKAKGVPEAALRGSTKEEFEAHADELKPLLTGISPVIPTQGDSPTHSATVDEDRKFADFLVGRQPD